MAMFTRTAGSNEREPLGGREADGFDEWLTLTTEQTREARDHLRETLPLSNPMRYVATEAARHYHDTLSAWSHVKIARNRGERDDPTRDNFETGLIAYVMRAYGAAEFARSQGYGPNGTTSGGRPVADISAEYLRGCLVLAKYVGISELTVAACQDDQAALSALRA